MFARWIFLASLVLAPLAARAQALADKVPADALIYVAWQGADHLPASYQQTHLKALLDESRFPELFNTAIPALIARVNQEDPQAAQVLRTFVAVAGPLWRHPTALYTSGADFAAGMPVPRVALLCQAGAEADALLAQFNALLNQANAQQAPFPLKAFKQGDIVGVFLGYADEKAAVAADASRSILSSDHFKSAIAQVQKEPVCLVYADTEGMLNQINTAVTTFAPPEGQQKWGIVRDASGIMGIKRVIWSGGFDGKDWATQAFIAAPGPRKGLPALLDAAPISQDMYKAIPASATIACVARLDLGRLLREFRDALGQIDPAAQQQFDQALGFAQMALGMNVQKDLLESLGDEWGVYLDPSSAGRGPLGVTLLNRLARPQDANRAIKKLEMAASNVGNGQLAARENMRLHFDAFTSGDLTIHRIALPVISPSWAIQGNYLFAGLYPRTIATAWENTQGKSILENEAFASLRSRLGGEKAGSFVFFDLPRTIEDNYQYLQAGVEGLTGFAELMGINTPPMVLPSLKALRQHLSPAASFAWTDDQGWHSRGVSPLPGSQLLGSPEGILMAVPVMAGFVTPALFRARAAAENTRVMSNLRQLGLTATMYANDNKGRYPADLGTLMISQDLPIDAFVAPGSPIPANIRSAKREDQAAWVNDHSDYVWLGANLKSTDPGNTILAYQKPESARNAMVGLLFTDGHCEMMHWAAAAPMIQRQQGK